MTLGLARSGYDASVSPGGDRSSLPKQKEVRPLDMASPKKLRVVVGTPFGHKGRGGMDRLTDLIVETLKSQPDLGIEAKSLTTRGQRSVVAGLFVFAYALLRFWLALRRGQVDLLHLNVAAGGSVYRSLFSRKSRELRAFRTLSTYMDRAFANSGHQLGHFRVARSRCYLLKAHTSLC